MPGAEDRLRRVNAEMARAERALETQRRHRDEALLALVGEGWGYLRIGKLLGVSKSRVQRMVADATRRLAQDFAQESRSEQPQVGGRSAD